MTDKQLFELALGLTSPWYVKSYKLEKEDKKFTIHLDFQRGGRFSCPKCGKICGAYDTCPQEWRHLNFFEHETYLKARVPRIECSDCGVVKTNVPWATPGSGFTLLMEAFIMSFASEMPILPLAKKMNETDNRLWRVVKRHVADAVAQQNFEELRHVGVDETAAAKGHKYVTLFVDMDESKVIHVEKGKGAETIGGFADEIEAKGGECDKITDVCMDMSPSFISGVELNFPDAAKTIKRHWDGVLRWFESHLTNGVLEGINSLVQAAKARARGYRNIENFKAMIFLVAGKLDFQLPI